MSSRTDRLAGSAIGSVLRLAEAPDIIALAAGSPALETLRPEIVAEVVTGVLARPGALQYGDAQGLPALREWIAAEQCGLLGRSVEPAQIVLTHGSQQALDLLCKALLDPGDVVLVDRPSYVGALQVFNLFQAQVVSVPLAADSDLSALDTALQDGLRPKLAYTVSNFANPSGLSLSLRQRQRLTELADRYGFLLVEDDPYGELWYTGHARPPAALASCSPASVRLGSFSKVLFPAARLGYVTSPPQLAEVLVKLKQAADLGNSGFLESIVHELVRRPGFMPAQLAATRRLYRDRRDALVASLRASLGSRVSFEEPHGGFFVWALLASGLSADRLLGEALAERVSFVPGHAFYAEDADQATLRLSFSNATVEQLTTAGPRLARALDRVGA